MVVVFIGRNFYHKSGTFMSPMYEKVGDMDFRRTDWNVIELELEKGRNVYIRQATPKEQEYFKDKLNDTSHKPKETNKYRNDYDDYDHDDITVKTYPGR